MNLYNTQWLQAFWMTFTHDHQIVQRNTTKLNSWGCYSRNPTLWTTITYSTFLGMGTMLSRRPSFNISFSSRLTTILRAPLIVQSNNDILTRSIISRHLKTTHSCFAPTMQLMLGPINLTIIFNLIANIDICKNQSFFIGSNLFSLKNRVGLLYP